MIRKLLFVLCLLIPGIARAEWRQATSENFIVYSQDSEQELRDAVAKLERFHFILRATHNITRPPSPIRLKVFLLRNAAAVARSLPYESGGVNGYYEANLRGPMIVGTRSVGGGYRGLDPEIVLQHEYAHHFMYSYFPAIYPTWYTEGFAEFWGNSRLLENDVFEVGHPARDRLSEFAGGAWLPLHRVLGARSYGDVGNDINLIYSQGWLLVRYLFENRERRGQLDQYLNLINAGVSYEEAMDRAFGEGARELNDELFEYAGSQRFNVFRLPFRRIAIPEIRIRSLRPAEEALLGHEILLGLGVLQSDAVMFAREVRAIAARHPDDAYAAAMLVEAEQVAGDRAAARVAVDRLLALDPRHARGLAWRGLLQAESLGRRRLRRCRRLDHGARAARRSGASGARRSRRARSLL